MSKKEQKIKKDYAAEIGLEPISLYTAGIVAQLCWYDKHVPLFISDSGIGKTAHMKQLAEANGMEFILYSLAHCEPTDVQGPMWPAEDGKYSNLRDGRIPFKGFEDEDRPALLCFDEANRAEMTTLNAVFPAWSERRIGTYELGRNVVVSAAMNPPDGSYAVTGQFSSDPAMRRRVCQLVINFSTSDFLRWAENPVKSEQLKLPKVEFDPEYEAARKSRPLHQAVIDYIRTNPDDALDTVAREAGQIYATPATWALVSDTFYTIERLKLNMSEAILHQAVMAKIAGHVGASLAGRVLDFYGKQAEGIDPHEVLLNFKKGTRVYDRVMRIIQNRDYAQLETLLHNCAKAIFDPVEGTTQGDYIPQIGLLMLSVPPQSAQAFTQSITEANGEVNGAPGEELIKFSMLLSADASFRKYRSNRVQMLADARDAANKADDESDQDV